MNERIEKLALQAREYADELLGSGLPDTAWQDRYHEKFAELIIKECVLEAMDAVHHNNSIRLQLYNHFGIA